MKDTHPKLSLPLDDVVFSLKTFAAAMLAYWICLYFGLKNPFWAVGTVYIIAHPLSGAITSKAVYRLMGTALGAAAIIVIVPNLVATPELLSLGMAFWTGACLFISVLDRSPRSYAFMLAGYTAVLTGFTLVEVPGTTFDVAIARVQEISIGVLCAAVVSRAIWPRSASLVLSHRVHGWLDDAVSYTQYVLSSQGKEPSAVQARQKLAVDAADLRNFTVHVKYEGPLGLVLAEQMTAIQLRVVALIPLLADITDILITLRLQGHAENDVDRWLQTISSWLSSRDSAKELQVDELVQEISSLQPSGACLKMHTNYLLGCRLLELIEIWRECKFIESGVSPVQWQRSNTRFFLDDGESKIHTHADYGMALLSAVAVVVAILGSCALWIGLGWNYGAGATQMASILCCVLATMDDAMPALRKVMWIALWSVLVTFIYQFMLLPFVEGFWPLVAALGLFLIPVGIMLATPARWLVGFLLSVNLIFMLQLHDKKSMDFSAFINSSVATVVGVVIAMFSLAIIRKVGAETSVKRILHSVWRQVYQAAEGLAPLDKRRLTHTTIDRLASISPRLALLSSESVFRATDLLRDLRVGLYVTSIQAMKSRLASGHRLEIVGLLQKLSLYYKAKCAHRDESNVMSVECFDDLLDSMFSGAACEAKFQVIDALVGLRSALYPEAPYRLGSKGVV